MPRLLGSTSSMHINMHINSPLGVSVLLSGSGDSRLVSFTVERRVFEILKAWLGIRKLQWHVLGMLRYGKELKMRRPGKRSRERDAYFCSDHKDDKDKYFFKVLVGDFRERLVLPDKFVQRFRGLVTNSVKLESRCGHTFDVEVAKNLGKVVIQTGWKAFVTAHNLNMGDLLVFKYDGTSRLKVLIFDPSCCEKVLPVKRNHIQGRERREELIEISSSYEDLPMKSPGSKRKGSMNVKISPSTSPSDTSGYILPQGTYLTCVQMKKLEKVRASTSAIPIYGCIMKKSSVQGRTQTVDMPRVYAEVYLPFEDHKLMLQCCGKSWEVRCFIQKGNPGTKRLFQGWKQFARDNKLQLGDLCLFELLENTKYTMKVDVVRAR